MILSEHDLPSLLLRQWEDSAEPAPLAERRSSTTGGGLALQIQGAGKRFGAREVLRGVDLHIAPGEFVAIVGRSGCGKSTLLRLVAGLEQADSGSLALDGRAPKAERDDVRIMFQDARLLPWKRVADNIALGLWGGDAPARARGALAQVG
ncbi:MAG: ATP-binding cassette domain-containing protein, partial [Rubrivivax sp.]